MQTAIRQPAIVPQHRSPVRQQRKAAVPHLPVKAEEAALARPDSVSHVNCLSSYPEENQDERISSAQMCRISTRVKSPIKWPWLSRIGTSLIFASTIRFKIGSIVSER